MKKEFGAEFSAAYVYHKDGGVELGYKYEDSNGVKAEGDLKEADEEKMLKSFIKDFTKQTVAKKKALKEEDENKPTTDWRKEVLSLQEENNALNVELAKKEARYARLVKKNEELVKKLQQKETVTKAKSSALQELEDILKKYYKSTFF